MNFYKVFAFFSVLFFEIEALRLSLPCSEIDYMGWRNPSAKELPASSPDGGDSSVSPGAATLVCLLVSSALLWRRSHRRRPSKSSMMDLVAYRMDNFFSTSPYASGLLLLAITLALVVLGGLGLWLAQCAAEGECETSPLGAMWEAWRFVTDGGDYHVGHRARLKPRLSDGREYAASPACVCAECCF